MRSGKADVSTVKHQHGVGNDRNGEGFFPESPLHPGETLAFPLEFVEGSVPARFESVVSHNPDGVALLTLERAYSYKEVDRLANTIAHAILASGSPAGTPIALLLDHGAPSVVAIVAALKAGRPYVALDPHFPLERLGEIVRDAGTGLLLTHQPLREVAMELGMRAIDVDELEASLPDTTPSVPLSPDTLGALFYTSGSMGQPKAVMQNHRNMLHRAWLHVGTHGIHPHDRVSLLHGHGYSAGTRDLLGALLGGAVLCPFDLRKAGFHDFTAWLMQFGITTLHAPLAYLRHWLGTLSEKDHFGSVRLISIGGQRVLRQDIERLRNHFHASTTVQIVMAGTETNAFAELCIPLSTELDVDQVPVGYAVPGRTIEILDEAGRPLPHGRVGEIAVRSRYHSPGYWRDPELTRDRFREAGGGERLCLTGDLGRLRADGCLEFMGRRDTLVKVRGYRVQLGDIEAALHLVRGVQQAAVIGEADADDETRLRAFIILDRRASLSEPEVRAALSARLPEYMLPSEIVFVDRLPVTSTGKIDRASLAQADPAARSDVTQPPGDPLEKELVTVWEQVLGVDSVGRSSDFFALGGNSLLAMRLFARLERELGIRIPVAVLFGAPTVAQLAAAIRSRDTDAAWPSLMAVQPLGGLPPFFCASPLVVDVLAYRGLALEMGTDQPFYALYSQGREGAPRGRDQIVELAARYVSEIRAVQPHGPYYLGGYSFGGKIAYEMARQLATGGEPVGLLAFLEVYGPGYLTPYIPAWLFSRVRNLGRLEVSLADLLPWAMMHWRNLRQGTPSDRAAYIRSKLAGRIRQLQRVWRRSRHHRRSGLAGDPGLVPRPPKYPAYDPGGYNGRVALFRAEKQPLGIRSDPAMGWGSLLKGEFEIHSVPGFHDTILFGPRVKRLASMLNESLARARTASGSSP
jgi:amino acid adenylation domain-containing protein